jgi:hypothetical protein
VRKKVFFLVFASLPLVALVDACGAVSSAPDAGHPRSDASVDRATLDASFRPDAACEVLIDTPPLLDGPHVAIGTDVTYSSNPPSSGPHYPIWAAFQEFATPVDRRYYVHDLEHGAIVLLYNCALLPGADAGASEAAADSEAGGDGAVTSSCEVLVQNLRNLMSALPEDPLCDADAGLHRRVVLTPDPLITVPVAAAAWGWTYRAQCFDRGTLDAFARDHYAHATENFCTNGQTTF